MRKYDITQKHPFHLVDPSPWPLVVSIAVGSLVTNSVFYFYNYSFSFGLLMFSFALVVLAAVFWWRDVIRESTFEGQHTSVVQLSLRFGVILFIVSEALLFFAFFWAFFWAALAPVPEIGSVWPPQGITVLDAWEVPFLNTLILLSSGATVTWAHHAIVSNYRWQAIVSLGLTILLAVLFTRLQAFEYCNAQFTISDGIYGTVFYLLTGFHGVHVIIGTIFLTVSLVRIIKYHYTCEHHFGFEAAAWYWHFVDVVWLFLFVSVYWWGS